MTSHVLWICLKCGEACLLWSHSGIMPQSDKCIRCGWIRPMKEETKEEKEKRWMEHSKENKKNNGRLPKGF